MTAIRMTSTGMTAIGMTSTGLTVTRLTATRLNSTGDQAIHEMEHGPYLAGRAAGDVEEGQQFGRRTALEALGDVVGHRERRATNLTR